MNHDDEFLHIGHLVADLIHDASILAMQNMETLSMTIPNGIFSDPKTLNVTCGRDCSITVEDRARTWTFDDPNEFRREIWAE